MKQELKTIATMIPKEIINQKHKVDYYISDINKKGKKPILNIGSHHIRYEQPRMNIPILNKTLKQ